MEKITLYKYLANRVPAEAHMTINRYGNYRKARSAGELEFQLKDFVKKFGDRGLLALAEIHPDRPIIEAECTSCSQKDKEIGTLVALTKEKPESKDSNNEFLNAVGDLKNEMKQERMVKSINTNMILIGGFVLMGVALMLKKQKY